MQRIAPRGRLDRLARLQSSLAVRIVEEDHFRKPIKSVGGVDLAFQNDRAVAACVVCSYPSLELVEVRARIFRLRFPYIPGFLGFREGPPIMSLFKSLRHKPTLLMVNAHGIAHPRFFGCASYVGLKLNHPTIGVARSKLCGKYESEPKRVGDWTPLVLSERIIGAVLRTQKEMGPVFVSVGHKVSLKTAVGIVKRTLREDRLPYPVQEAHRIAGETKRKFYTLKLA